MLNLNQLYAPSDFLKFTPKILVLVPKKQKQNRTQTLKNGLVMRFLFGADNGIWTRDLVLTKDALYLLSYISIILSALWQH